MWDEIQDMSGEIFDIDQALEDINNEKENSEDSELERFADQEIRKEMKRL